MKIIANNYEAHEVIKIVREWTELTQKEFAKDINRSRDGIQKYENGKRKFTFETFLLICQKYNIKVIVEKEK